MKGKTYLLISSILLIIGAAAGLLLSVQIFMERLVLLPGIPASSLGLTFGAGSVLLLAAGIVGIIVRNKSTLASVIWGIVGLITISVSMVLIFYIGDGAAPLGVVLTFLACLVVLILYISGAFLNRQRKLELRW